MYPKSRISRFRSIHIGRKIFGHNYERLNPGILGFLNSFNETWIWMVWIICQFVELQKSIQMIANSNQFLGNWKSKIKFKFCLNVPNGNFPWATLTNLQGFAFVLEKDLYWSKSGFAEYLFWNGNELGCDFSHDVKYMLSFSLNHSIPRSVNVNLNPDSGLCQGWKPHVDSPE